ncbi:MAG: 50S ribosomal protein L29 [Candidatus Berkelbacteria bacterium]|nr:50S ribosomal protein L29 [Candidatus Berkelbacteria bacterium]
MKKKIQLKEIREKDDKALYTELASLNKKLVELQFKTAFRKQKNYHEITDTKKKVARVWTVLGERAEQKLESK